MNYREVSLHGFENPDTQNVGVDNGGDIPEGFGSQLNLFYPRNGETVFAVPHRDGKQIGDVGYVIEGRPEATKWRSSSRPCPARPMNSLPGCRGRRRSPAPIRRQSIQPWIDIVRLLMQVLEYRDDARNIPHAKVKR